MRKMTLCFDFFSSPVSGLIVISEGNKKCPRILDRMGGVSSASDYDITTEVITHGDGDLAVKHCHGHCTHRLCAIE